MEHFPENLLFFLKTSELFSNLSDEELTILLPLFKSRMFKTDAWIIREGEPGDHLFLLRRGRAEIVKEEKGVKERSRLATLEPGDWFGEMAFFESEGRSASVRALEESEMLILSLKDLARLEKKESSTAKITRNLGKELSSRLRETNETLVKSLKQEIKLIKTHDQVAQLIVHIFILLTFYFYIFKILDTYETKPVETELISLILLIGFAVSASLIIKRSGYSLRFYGITLKNWKRHALEATLFTLPLLAGMMLLKWGLITYLPSLQQRTLFEFASTHFYLFSALYLLFVPVQEFLVRGCLQSCFQNFFRSKNSVFLAILASNLLFGMFHSHKTLSLAIIAMCMGVFWGWLYARQKSLVGPIVSHFLVGAWAFSLLNFESLLTF